MSENRTRDTAFIAVLASLVTAVFSKACDTMVEDHKLQRESSHKFSNQAIERDKVNIESSRLALEKEKFKFEQERAKDLLELERQKLKLEALKAGKQIP